MSKLDLEQAISMNEAISMMELAFRELATKRRIQPPRVSVSIPNGGWIGVMPAYLEGINAFSTKIVSIYPQNSANDLPTTMATVILNEPETGKILSIMDGTYITAIRTGALGGLAAKYLSRKDSQVVGIIGSGVQARTQLIALKAVRNINRVLTYDIVPDRAKKFVREMSKTVQTSIEVCSSPVEAVQESDIVVTVSTSKEPLFDGAIIKPGTHLNAFGNFKPDERELDSNTIKRSKIFVDLREAALAEAGDLVIPIEKGEVSEDNILGDLGEIITGSKIGRASTNDITLFKSVGLSIQDCAASSLAYRKAVEMGLGTTIEL